MLVHGLRYEAASSYACYAAYTLHQVQLNVGGAVVQSIHGAGIVILWSLQLSARLLALILCLISYRRQLPAKICLLAAASFVVFWKFAGTISETLLPQRNLQPSLLKKCN